MPELPEVETVCRTMRRALVGHRITHVEVAPDDIVFGEYPRARVEDALLNRTVSKIGRKGKFWWIELEDGPPVVFGHLGYVPTSQGTETAGFKGLLRLVQDGKACERVGHQQQRCVGCLAGSSGAHNAVVRGLFRIQFK